MKLRVLSYNIHKGFNFWGNRFVLPEIKKAIHETQADIVFLQEVVGFHLQQQKNENLWPTEGQFEFLAETLWPHFSYGKNASFPQRHHGNAILSRFPIDLVSNKDISTNSWERRGLLRARIHHPDTGSELHLLNTHLNLRESCRKKQQSIIIDEVHGLLNHPIIFAGDFNDWRQNLSADFESKNQLLEAHYVANGEHAKSYPSFRPMLSLDRIYFRHLKVESAVSLAHESWTGLSDHLPLVVEFEWN